MIEHWQDKAFREAFEIEEFIKRYEKQYGKKIEIIKKREKPDYLVLDKHNGLFYGVELTSVYLTDRSVFEENIHPETKRVPCDPVALEQYKQRILRAVSEKIQKARIGYDLTYPLLLSVYVNEYLAAYLEQSEWVKLEQSNTLLFQNISPFEKIGFWPLPKGEAYFVNK